MVCHRDSKNRRSASGKFEENVEVPFFQYLIAAHGLRVCLLMLFLALAPLSRVLAGAGPRPDLVVAYSTRVLSDVDPKDAVAAFESYIGELAKEINRTAGSHPYDNIETLVKEVEDGKVDLITMNSIDYLRLKNKAIFELGMAYDRGGKTTTKYLILSHQNKGYSKIGDLRGKKIAVGIRDEVGILFLNTTLLKLRFGEAKGFFSQVDEKIKPSQVVLSVFFGQTDACVISDVLYKTMVEMNPQLGKDLKVLASSSELLEVIGLFRKGMDENIKQITLEMSKNLKTHARGKQILMLFKIDALLPLKETDFAGIRELVNDYDRLKGGR